MYDKLMSQSPYGIAPKTLAYLRKIAGQLAPTDILDLISEDDVKRIAKLNLTDSEHLATLVKENSYIPAALYQLLLSTETRFRSGITYTPPDLADTAAAATIRYLSGERFKLLDPACGGGILLKSLTDYLPGKVDSATALDLDPQAVTLTEFLFKDSGLTPKVYLSDALQSDLELKFDAIIMNPPYGSFRDRPNIDIKKSDLKNTFGKTAGGKLNLYMAFVLHYLKYLETGGVLTAIIPNSWLGINDGRYFRQQLITNRYIREIKINAPEDFPDLGVETVILTLKLSAADSFIIKFTDGTAKSVAYSELDKDARISLTTSESRIPTSKATVPLKSLQDVFEIRIGLQAYRFGGGNPPQSNDVVKSHPFHSTCKGPTSLKYLRGADVGRYKCEWSGVFLDYGPWLAECPPSERFSGPRIVVREILGPPPHLIQATIVDEPAVYNRSILQIRLVEPKKLRDLLALLGYLNSALVSLHLLQCGRKAQRALFPKLVVADLKDLPITNRLFAPQCEVADLVEARLLCKDLGQSTALDLAIDKALAKALEINATPSQIEEEIMTMAKRIGLKRSSSRSNSTCVSQVQV